MAKSQPAQPNYDTAVVKLLNKGRLWRSIIGIVLVIAGAVTLLTVLGLNTGGVLAGAVMLLQKLFGIGIFLLCIIAIGMGGFLLLNPNPRMTRRRWVQVILAEVAFFSFLALIHTMAFGADPYQLVQSGGGGGAVGWVLSEALWQVLGVSGSGMSLMRLLSLLIWLVVFAFSAFIVVSPLLVARAPLQAETDDEAPPRSSGLFPSPSERGSGEAVAVGHAPIHTKPWEVAAPEQADLPTEAKQPRAGEPKLDKPIRGTQLPLPERADKKPAKGEPQNIRSNAVIIKADEAKHDKPAKPYVRPDTLPRIDLLKAVKEVKNSDADAKRLADVIETTLSQFGLAGKVVEIRRGPTVTQFGIEPGYMDRGSQSRDKALLKMRNALNVAVYEAVDVELSVEKTTAQIKAPVAIVDAKEAGFKSLLKALLAELDLSASVGDGDRRSGRAVFEIGADTERKLKIKASQVSNLRRELASALSDRLFELDDFAGSDQLTERLTISFPAGIADALNLKDVLEATIMELGLAGEIDLPRRSTKADIAWAKQAQKVRVGAIAALQNDFALALAAPSIRIEAPIPGRGLVGIEVPNANIGTVDLRSLMESESFRKIAEKSPLAIALGRDVSGTAANADLGRMPHVLIAGTTGSGKSVCISAITVCLAMNNRPEDLKLVMIDPKMVELSRFAGLPHIIGKPESDIDRIPGVLRWVTREMDSRYKKFAEMGSRNLGDYNEAMARKKEAPLPRIVVLIDELADLMLQSPIETEKTICRLAQMARATGIHLVVATQRPSVDVVTGLIKANFPARISFAVASATDSRVILDQIGAESLLGRGDMLFLNPEKGSPERLQGCFVSDKEVEGVIDWWKMQIETEKQEKIRKGELEVVSEEEYVANKKPEFDTPWEMVVAEMAAERQQNSSGGSGSGGMDDDGGDDELINKAMEIIRANGNVSTSLLQRKLRIGYPRAARLMEELKEMGYVGDASKQAGKGRDVLMKDTE
jgi:hypothetical protein